MASLRADVRRLVETLQRDHGCTVRQAKSGHWRVSREGYGSVTVAGSPSDQRALANARADARRHLGISL